MCLRFHETVFLCFCLSLQTPAMQKVRGMGKKDLLFFNHFMCILCQTTSAPMIRRMISSVLMEEEAKPDRKHIFIVVLLMFVVWS